MGMRGPQRKPGSVRWKREMKKKKAALGQGVGDSAGVNLAELPTCPRGLSRAIADRWMELLSDMIAAGIKVKQVDARAIAICARYEASIDALDEICENGADAETRLSAIRTRLVAMKEHLSALERVGGTPIVRLRARIEPEDKPPKVGDDPWQAL